LGLILIYLSSYYYYVSSYCYCTVYVLVQVISQLCLILMIFKIVASTAHAWDYSGPS
jgi:hypothetical protein